MLFTPYKLCGGCQKPILHLNFVYLIRNHILFVVPRNVAPPSELWLSIGMDSDDDIHGTPFCCLSVIERVRVLVEMIAEESLFSDYYVWVLPHRVHEDSTSSQVERFDGILVSVKYMGHKIDYRDDINAYSKYE